jgi:hypothetical protein
MEWNDNVTGLFQLFSSLQEQARASFLRTDVLRGLIWPTGFVATMLLILALGHGPNWLLVGIFVLFVVLIVFYLSSFYFFMKSDPDALRSERYSLQKIAIEKHLIGDSNIGIIDEVNSNKIINATAPAIEMDSNVEGDE